MLAPLTSLVGECGQTKVTRAKWTKKVPWHWNEVHQRVFNHVKATIAREVVLAYPDYSKVFEIYTDASSKQLGAVIIQENRPIAFFSWKLSTTQRKYIVTKNQTTCHSQNHKRVQRDAMGPFHKSVY